jgi:predicted ATPase
MRIRSLHIENYRCLKSVMVEFTSLTVLVGPNGCGKTTLLSALQPDLRPQGNDLWMHDGALMLHRYGTLSDGTSFSDKPGIGAVAKRRWTLQKLQLRPVDLRKHNTLQQAAAFQPSGENFANVFATLPRSLRQQVAEQLCALVPLYRDADTRPSGAGQHRIVFQDRWTPSVWFEPDEVSDGTMVLLAFLTLTHLETPPDIVAIEHPEEALHPYLLGEVVGMLRQLAEGKLGPKAVQVVLSTHSPTLLNFAQPEEVRFLSRNLQDGSTIVRRAPTESEQWKAAYADYEQSLGEMWMSGGLGGVPALPPEQ